MAVVDPLFTELLNETSCSDSVSDGCRALRTDGTDNDQ